MKSNCGCTSPLGASLTAIGVNFCVFSAHAKQVELVLFDHPEARCSSRTIVLDPVENRTGHYWHIEVPGLEPGQVYGYRMDGPMLPERGYCFDRSKILLDPYSRAVCPALYDRQAASLPGDNEDRSMRSIVVDSMPYDWEGDRPLQLSFRQTVIYELHVGGFTRNPNSGVPDQERGTFAGIVRKIPYLKQLGITAVELMPIFQFDQQDSPAGLENYWGYSPVSFFAPHLGYSVSRDPMAAINEFRDMVKALHRAGIEVILDVVYNHTAEGGTHGPTLCWKGIDNSLYYTLTPDRRSYADFTGTGNTLNANQSVVRRMILDSLHYWVKEMHVDGFRFDLASVLSRDELGIPVSNAPTVWDIDSDPVLAGSKLMAEAWDAAGLYQVGNFSRDHWKEWNGRFRDDVRSFLKSDSGMVPRIKQRLMGSPDLYTELFHPLEQSINFVTCHDGFTLNDLVSYDQKHNEANGEGNRDGADANLSWNCGVEGPTEDAAIESLRARQIRNAFAFALLSVGTPLLLMGDEVRRTQHGNNNAYCQNNAASWFDWDLCGTNADLQQFVSHLIALRLTVGSDILHQAGLTLRDILDHAKIDWHGVQLFSPDLSESSRTLAATAYLSEGLALHLMLNFFWEPLQFQVPPVPNGLNHWFLVFDTYQDVMPDIAIQVLHPLDKTAYLLQPRSIVLLAAINEQIIASPLGRMVNRPSF